MLDTINVIQIPDGNPKQMVITAFPNTEWGRQASKELFEKLADENYLESEKLSWKQIAEAVQEGVFEHKGFIVLRQFSRT